MPGDAFQANASAQTNGACPADHTAFSLDVDISQDLASALERQYEDDTPPTDLEILLADAGLGEILEPLTPLPGSGTASPMPVDERGELFTAQDLRDMLIKLEEDAGLRGALGALTPLPESESASPMRTDEPAALFTARVLHEVSTKLQELSNGSSTKPGPTKARSARPRSDHRRQLERKAKNDRRRKKRAREREQRLQAQQQDSAFSRYKVRRALLRKFNIARTLVLDVDARDLPACEGAWKGQYIPENTRCLSLQEALSMGLKLFEWDGREPILLVDRSQRIIGVLVGRPADVVGREPWEDTMAEAYRAMDALGEQMDWGDAQALPHPPGSDGANRRGDYFTASEGPSYGGGQTHPMNFLHTPVNQAAIDEFNANPAIQRCTAFASASHAFYAPKLFRYAVNTLQDLYGHHPELDPGHGPFANRSPNKGPKVATHLHNDHCNLAFGWCAIQSLGDFNPKEGGHLILQQFGIVVEFPPGSTVLIPSAVVTHGNTPIPAGQTRASLVHYSAGGLFRWVEYGFQTWENLKKRKPRRARQLWRERKRTRVQFALGLFSKLNELEADHAEVFGK